MIYQFIIKILSVLIMESIRKYYSRLPPQIAVNLIAGGGVLVTIIVNSSLMKFYTDMIGFSPKLFSIVFVLYSIWNAINDPLIGFWADKAAFIEGKGKYKRMVRKSIPLISFPVIAIFLGQPSWNQTFLAIYLLILMVIYEGAQTLLNVSFAAFVVNTFVTSKKRTQMQTIRTYISQIPAFTAGLIPMFFLTGEYSTNLIVIIFSATILFGVIIIFIGYNFIKEDKHFYDKLEVTHGLGELWRFFVSSLQSKSFVIFMIALFLINIATGNYFVGYLYYMDNVLLQEGLWVVIPDILTGVGQMIILPFIIGWVKKFGVRNTLASGLILSVIGFFILFFTVGYWVVASMYILILLGFAFSSAAQEPLKALVIDDLELKTGKRQPGLLGGIIALVTIPGASLQVLIIGALLSNAGYDGTVKKQTPQVVEAIRIGVGLIPATLLALGIMMLFLFPIGRKEEEVIGERLLKKHEIDQGSLIIEKYVENEEPLNRDVAEY